MAILKARNALMRIVPSAVSILALASGKRLNWVLNVIVKPNWKLEMIIRYCAVMVMFTFVATPFAVANNSAGAGPRVPVLSESDVNSLRQAYPNGAPVSNARKEILSRFLLSFDASPALAKDYGEVQVSQAHKPNTPARLRVVKLPADMQRRLSFLDSVVLASIQGNRVCDDVSGELFPYALNTGPDLPDGLKYRTDAAVQHAKQHLKVAGSKDLLLIPAIPRCILSVYPGLFTETELDDPLNFRRIKQSNVTLPAIQELRKPWLELYLSNRSATRADIEALRAQIDQNSLLSLP